MTRYKRPLPIELWLLRSSAAATVAHMSFPRGAHVFVDESKARGYYIAAVAVAPSNVAPLEARLRGLRAGGRSSIHFNEEGNRRDFLTREFAQMDVRARIYVMRGAKDTVARPALLRTLVDDLAEHSASRLVLERDESVQDVDRRVIFEALRRQPQAATLRYDHRDRKDQPMLWLPDAVAWCFQAGGPWPAKISTIIDDVIEVARP